MAQSGSTMQLTRAADYAVRVTIHLATLPDHERALLPALARATGAPLSFLSKVLAGTCAAPGLLPPGGDIPEALSFFPPAAMHRSARSSKPSTAPSA